MKGGGSQTRQWMLRAFKLHGCAICGKRPPIEISLHELHCHHRDPTTKRQSMASNVLGNGGGLRTSADTLDDFLDELLKCDVLCVECHAKQHASGHGDVHVQISLFSGTGEAWRVMS